ncbi:MAG TPA: hypothetical protein VKB86_11415 [Pyrinomonadaceae bacterium]|nr:hypothetical protein [Pyrinomonadaceae bacterium]
MREQSKRFVNALVNKTTLFALAALNAGEPPALKSDGAPLAKFSEG